MAEEEDLGVRMEASLSENGIQEISQLYTTVNEKIGTFVVGNQKLVDFILVAMLSEGHILIEGVPGTAKTTIAKSVALITGCGFNRIQGAIDLQPTDMIGVRIYDTDKKEFSLRKGPVFTNILLADEINRVNPKSQSAFIEAMSERQVTIDGITMALPSPFFVIATQNPFEFEGTFPLIEAQRDRFMFGISSAYLSAEEELNIIKRVHSGQLLWETFARTLTPLLSPQNIQDHIEAIRHVTVEDPVLEYIRDLVMATRTHPDINLGGSSRASIALVNGGKALAALRNRSFVIPDDIKEIAPAALNHRIIISREAEIGGLTSRQVLDEILSKVEVL
ncbi:MAG: MoxR family ATPase [Methanoregula sp.]|nr:MoxR family ATPase [Methanoregula sp.]